MEIIRKKKKKQEETPEVDNPLIPQVIRHGAYGIDGTSNQYARMLRDAYGPVNTTQTVGDIEDSDTERKGIKRIVRPGGGGAGTLNSPSGTNQVLKSDNLVPVPLKKKRRWFW